MQIRTLGHSGLKVSRLCLGTMMFGDRTDEAEARRILDHARESGVDFLDTADMYAAGRSEEMVGRLIAQDRDAWVLATKAGNPVPGVARSAGLSRAWLMRAIDGSLKRLGTDRVDLWYLHLDDRITPVEETVTAVGDAIRAGMVLYWGFSNFEGWQIADMVHTADKLGVPRPVACQPLYNALNRQAERDILPACDRFGIGVMPYSPLARGMLTGKYASIDAPPEDSRAARADKRMLETEFRAESVEIAGRFKAHAKRRGRSLVDFALGWLLANDIVTSVVAGPRTLDQWQGYVAAARSPFDAEDEAVVEAQVAPGHSSTPGYNDPRYPLRGRRTVF